MSILDLNAPNAGGDDVPLPVEFRVPQDADHAEFMRLCDPAERARLRELGRCFAEMAMAKSLVEGAAYAAAKRAHLGRGFTAKQLRNLQRVWAKGGHKVSDYKKLGPCFPPRDFRALMRDYSAMNEGLSPDFVLFLGQTFAEFRGRDDAVRAWYRHFTHNVWLGNVPVPGYGKAKDWYEQHGRVLPHGLLLRDGDLPAGWSEANLRRYLPKRRAIRAQLAHGYLAAHGSQPDQVLGDRSFLLPFERVYLDDLRADFRSLWLNGSQGEIVYPLLVLGLDADSGVDLGNCAKPRALKEDGTKHGISRDMTLRVIVEIIRRWGLPRNRAITFVCEKAAAAVTGENRRLLEDAFGERVRFEDTAVFNERMTQHGFAEKGGRPWVKAPLESFFHVLQTQLAALRSTTGPRYDQKHGELAAIEEYTLALVDKAQGVAEVLALLQTPLPRFEAAHEAIERALKLLRFRTKHGLQGFERIVEAQLPDGRWLGEAQLALLPAEEQAAAKIVNRLESPAERFTRKLRGEIFDPIDPDLLTWIEGPRTKVTVRCGKIEVQDIAHANERLTFREVGNTLLEDEREGKVYEAAMARDASRLVLGDNGRLVGAVQRQGRVDLTDREAVQREMGRVRAARAMDRETLRGYLANEDTADQHMRAHNAALIATVPAALEAKKAEEIEAKKPAAKTNASNQRRAAQLAAQSRAQLSAPTL